MGERERDGEQSADEQEAEEATAPSRALSIYPSGRKCLRINKKRRSLERDKERALAQPRSLFCFIKQLHALFWGRIDNNELKGFCRHHC